MVNPVKQNAGQIPLSTQNFFESDGKTVSLPWRTFLRNISSSVGGETGTDGLPALIVRVNNLSNQVGFQATEIEQLFTLDAATANAIAIGALIARIGMLEQAAPAIVPVLQRANQSTVDLVSIQRGAMASADAPVVAPPRPATTPEQVFPIPISGAVSTASPAAGGAGALPATPTGYETRLIDGVPRKVAFY